ncbi:hypothetical protein KXD40_002508 [Peronospora effusa]|nr:hypothetical protein KXD40_002508 [Peronospora effusa]
MRFHYVSLLVAGASFESASANSAPTDTTPSTAALANSLTAGKDDVFVVRFLRTSVTADYNDELGEQFATVHEDDKERMISFNSLDAFKSKLTTLKTKLNGNPLKHAFRKYGLRKAKDQLLEHEKFNEWFTKTKELHPQNFKEEAILVLKHYYSDGELYKILDAGKAKSAEVLDARKGESTEVLNAEKGESTENVAKGLQVALINSWLADNVKPLDVFKNVEQASKLDDILTSPNLPVWTGYLKDYNIANPGHAMDEIRVLVNNYDEKAVFGMLEAAKEVEGTKKLATIWQEQQMKYWVDQKYSPAQVFSIMEHGRKLDDIFTSPYWPVWTKYLKDYNIKNPGHEMDEIRVLLDNYDEIAVLDMIQSTKKNPATKEVATKLQEKLIRKWLKVGGIPSHVLNIV